MKVVRNGKHYDYPYKNVILHERTHSRLKTLSQEWGMPITRVIKKLLDNQEK
jgi:hypothetical protein